jgi:hypothetical protein
MFPLETIRVGKQFSDCHNDQPVLDSVVENAFTKIASVIFGILSVMHLMRLVFGTSVIVGGFEVPQRVSFFGFLIPAGLSIMLWREAVA